jgi:hypothetical protein
MSAATVPAVTLNPEVHQFLRQHDAEGSFAKFCELVREVYPQLRSIEAELVPDPDEEDRCKIILWVQLPESTSMEEYHARHEKYHERLMSDIPLAHLPLFGVLTHFGGN